MLPTLPELPVFSDLTPERLGNLVTGLTIFVLGLLVARFVGRTVRRVATARASAQHGLIAGRLTTYGLAVLVTLEALHQGGFDLKVLLGAAGVLTLALGFAAQTSTSNLISGLFLMAERPFVLGDTIELGTTFGEVASIDLLSVKIRTFDNRWVRIPNESMLKQEIVNHTRFPIRRVDVDLQLAYDEDPERVMKILEAVADADEECLDEPRPTFFVLGFGESALRIRFTAWAATPNFIGFKNRFQVAIRAAFERESIRFPYARRTLDLDTPITVRLAGDEPSSDALRQESPDSENK